MCISPLLLIQGLCSCSNLPCPSYLTTFPSSAESFPSAHAHFSRPGKLPLPLLHWATIPLPTTSLQLFTAGLLESCQHFLSLVSSASAGLPSTTPLTLLVKVTDDLRVAKSRGQFSVFILQSLTQLITLFSLK